MIFRGQNVVSFQCNNKFILSLRCGQDVSFYFDLHFDDFHVIENDGNYQKSYRTSYVFTLYKLQGHFHV